MKVLQIAMLCHAANLAYCASLGDMSQVPWGDAPEWQRDSAVKGVEFCLANPDAPASANHESWMAEKVAAGWVFGEVKDPDANPPTHPCIVPFADLPPAQQFKDVLFKMVVAAGAAQQEDNPELGPDDTAIIAAHIGEIEGQVATLTNERDALTEQLAAVTKKLEAKPKTVTVKDAGPKLRKFKDIPGDDKLDRDGLRALIKNSDDVDVALIDDRGKEVAGSKPFTISGDVWRDHTLGLLLGMPVALTGGDAPYSFVGYALLVDGKHVATAWRSEPIKVAPGAKINIENDIVF